MSDEAPGSTTDDPQPVIDLPVEDAHPNAPTDRLFVPQGELSDRALAKEIKQGETEGFFFFIGGYLDKDLAEQLAKFILHQED